MLIFQIAITRGNVASQAAPPVRTVQQASQAAPPVRTAQQASEVERGDVRDVSSQGEEVSSPGEPLVSSDKNESSRERAPHSGIEKELGRNTGLRRILTLPSSMLTSTGDIANLGNSLDYLEGRTAELNSTISGLGF